MNTTTTNNLTTRCMSKAFAALALTFIFATIAGAQPRYNYNYGLDMTGDGKADPTVIRRGSTTSPAMWYIRNSTTGVLQSAAWGNYVPDGANGVNVTIAADIVVPGDFDGDHKGDFAIARRTGVNLVWYILRSTDGTMQTATFGRTNDAIVPGDYDGDAKCDIAIFRGSTVPQLPGWHWIRSSDGQFGYEPLPAGVGVVSNVVVPGDYDGDGKADFTYRIATNPNNNGLVMEWTIKRSSDNTVQKILWGAYTNVSSGYYQDYVAPGDYDGDGTTDLTAVRMVGSAGNYSFHWYIRRSSDLTLMAVQWGNKNQGHLLTPADYDGDGKTDISVWDKEEGVYYNLRSSNGTTQVIQWGSNAGNGYFDRPLRYEFEFNEFAVAN